MSLTQSVTIVVGAGSLVPYHFPTGRSLVRDICEQMTECAIDYAKAIDSRRADTIIERSQHLSNRLRAAMPPSIDTFLAEDGSQSEFLKFAIARILLKLERGSTGARPWDEDWIRWLFDHTYDRSNGRFSDRLRLIIFNYDRMIELSFHTFLCARYGLSHAEAENRVSKLQLVHMYGKLSSTVDTTVLPYLPKSKCDPASCLEASKGIKVMGDRESTDASELARQYMAASSSVVFLGFSYDPANILRCSPARDPDKVFLNDKNQLLLGGFGLLEEERVRAQRRLVGFPFERDSDRSGNTIWSGEAEGCETFLRRTASFVS